MPKNYDEVDYTIDDFDMIGDRYVDLYDMDDGVDYDDMYEENPVDYVALAHKYGVEE